MNTKMILKKLKIYLIYNLKTMWKDYEEIDWENWEYNDNEDSTNTPSWDNDKIITKDAHWVILTDWDSVIAIKDIKVKGASDIKRGDKFTKIKLTDDPELIESGKMVLRREFFKKN